MEVLLDDMAATLGATVTLPPPTPTSPLLPPVKSSRPPSLIARLQQPVCPTQGASSEEVGVGVGGGGVFSPLLPTSPPTLVHELSCLSLEGMGMAEKCEGWSGEMGEKVEVVRCGLGKGKEKGCVLVGGGMEERAGRVKV